MKIATLRTSGRSGEIAIGENKVTARSLSADEQDMLADVYVRPSPPLRRAPGTHPETGELVLRTDDEAYQQRLSVWRTRVQCLELAASCELESSGGLKFAQSMPSQDLKLWADAMYKELRTAFAWAIIMKAWEQVAALNDIEKQADDAVKN